LNRGAFIAAEDSTPDEVKYVAVDALEKLGVGPYAAGKDLSVAQSRSKAGKGS
jgi:hypothetical protein